MAVPLFLSNAYNYLSCFLCSMRIREQSRRKRESFAIWGLQVKRNVGEQIIAFLPANEYICYLSLGWQLLFYNQISRTLKHGPPSPFPTTQLPLLWAFSHAFPLMLCSLGGNGQLPIFSPFSLPVFTHTPSIQQHPISSIKWDAVFLWALVIVHNFSCTFFIVVWWWRAWVLQSAWALI